jgi:antitoxin HicB
MTNGADVRGYRLEVYQDEDGSWAAEVPDLPGAVAAAADPADLLIAAADAIDAWLEAATADGRSIPEPSVRDEQYSGRFVMRLPRTVHRRLAFAARLDGVSLNMLCTALLAEGLGSRIRVHDATATPMVTRFIASYVYSQGAPLLVSEPLARYESGGQGEVIAAAWGVASVNAGVRS